MQYQENNINNTAKAMKACRGLTYSEGALHDPEQKSRGPVKSMKALDVFLVNQSFEIARERQQQRREEIIKNKDSIPAFWQV